MIKAEKRVGWFFMKFARLRCKSIAIINLRAEQSFNFTSQLLKEDALGIPLSVRDYSRAEQGS